jgi:aminoglycoside phosphotransferase (APT) family kinase protein
LTGQTLRRLHQLAPPTQVAVHSAAEEVQVLERWLGIVALLDPRFAQQIRAQCVPVYQALQAAEGPAVLLHRDFFDKQVFISSAGEVGLLDFDTLATGEAALDLANTIIHFELRARQQQISWQQAQAASQRLLDAYAPAPSIRQRISAYANATRLRLACVYACRPGAEEISQQLRASINTPLLCKD